MKPVMTPVEVECTQCEDTYPTAYMEGTVCRFCKGKALFAEFAKSCGLELYPDPTGERYVYRLDGRCEGKKIECVELIDKLWNALVKAKGADANLLVPAR